MLRLISQFAAGSSSTLPMIILAVVLMAVCGLIAIYFIQDMIRKHKPLLKAPERSLWEQLCQLHRLSAHEETLLTQLQQLHELAQREVLFVRPDLFDVTGSELEAEQPQFTLLKDRIIGQENVA